MAEDQPGEIEPVYLTLDDVLGLHGLIIGAGSAEAADQLRNRDGLESALARPAAYAHYETLTWRSKPPCSHTVLLRVNSSSTATSEPRSSPC